MHVDVQTVQDAERLGYHSVWTAEAYGSDAVVPLAWIGALTDRIRLGTAIMQMPARTPAMTAMTAMTLDALSGGRFLLGLGVSGPAGGRGLARRSRSASRSADARVRRRSCARSSAREKPVEHGGRALPDPLRGPGATGLGKPLKSILHGRADLPIYLAAIGPKNVALAAEIADGWLPVFFSPERARVFHEALDEGFARAGGGKRSRLRRRADRRRASWATTSTRCRGQVKPMLALYIGGMGARGKNFYNDLAAATATRTPPPASRSSISRAGGRGGGRGARRPGRRGRAVRAAGADPRAAFRLWREAGVTTLVCAAAPPEAVRLMAELVL